jgi:hypothetical protein
MLRRSGTAARSAARCLAGPMFGRGPTLGCTGQACARARGLALGAQRFYPVARYEPDAASALRHGAQHSHLQGNTRDEARFAHPNVLRGSMRGSPGSSSTSRRPPVLLGWTTARQVRPRHVRPPQAPKGQGRGSRRRSGAPRSLHKTRTARWPANTKAHRTATTSSGA